MGSRMEMYIFLFLCLGFCTQEIVAQTIAPCKENEEYFECGSQCPLTCKNYQEPIFCTKPCTKGCFCKPGFVIGPNGMCIQPTDCPVGPCRKNEQTTDCVIPCNTCSERGKCYYEYCDKGCDCKPGFFKNSTGVCVPESKCDVQESSCPRNEHYVSCVNPCNDCWSRGADCGEDHYCQPGCDCLPGFFRNENDDCVPERQCGGKTGGGYCGGANEEYTECAVPCNDCQTRGKCQYQCEYGCDCKQGYHRDSRGLCIPASQCPSVCPEYEEYKECGSACPATCTNRGQIVSCNEYCVKGCFCKKGYVRGPDGKCVVPERCPLVCGVNEEYSECGSPCPLTCTNLTGSANCPKICVQGCVCKPGYVRGPTGACILPSQCPVVCSETEEFLECGSACPTTCANFGQITRNCSLACRRGCFCKPQYVRGPDGKCVLPQQCPVVCQENEQFLDCGPGCQASCNNASITSCTRPCTRGCFCKPGYIRGPNGRCIFPQQCPVVCPVNEEFRECGSPCQGTCDIPSKPIGLCPTSCKRGCFCKPGYVRDPYGKCILPEKCPVVCQENEVFLMCGSPCQSTCENIGNAVGACALPCIKGCFCKPGYIRGPNGRCILRNQCPMVCHGNEVLLSCGSPCQRTCDNLGQPIRPCTLPCIRGCFCKPGYVRGPTGDCVLPTQCPVVCGENEEYQKCATACMATCKNYTSNYECTLPCVDGCICKSGYVRSPDGKCILPSDCPVVCGENEIFENCGSSCPRTCSNRNSSVPCTLQCRRGCFCRPGYVRGPNGNCILPSLCPVVCGENEIFRRCGTACPIACSNRTSTDPCSLPCRDGCFCRPGFIRGPNGNCILPRFCPVECGENEEFSQCSSPCQRTCENRNSVINCTLPCLTGCFCKPGFVRDSFGNCIDPLSCPIGPCTKENEIYSTCGPACIRTCARREIRPGCPQRCVRGCFCREGFVRDIDANCIPVERCPRPPQTCPADETFYACKPTCRNTCDNLTFDGPCDDFCRPGCDCRGGLVRDTTINVCVPPRECPNSVTSRRKNNVEPDTTTILAETQPANTVTESKPPVTEAKPPVTEVTKPTTPPPGTAATAAASPVTGRPVATTTLQPEPPKTEVPPTTLKVPATENAEPTVIQTKSVPLTTIKMPATPTINPTTVSPVTIANTNQQETDIPTKAAEPVKTTPQKPATATTPKPEPTTQTSLPTTNPTAKPEITTKSL